MEPRNPNQDLYGLEPIEQQENTLSFFKKAVSIFINPVRAFEAIRQKPDVFLPYCASMLVAALFSFVTMGLMQDYTLETMAASYQQMGMEIPADQLQSFARVTMISTIVAMIAVSVIAPFVKGAIAHLLSLAFEAKTTFKRSLSVVAYAYLIMMLGTLIRIPLALMTKNYLFTFSPAMFLGDAAPTDPLFSFLSAFDLFTIWYLAVSVIGFKTVHKLKTWQAAVVVLLPFVMSLVSALIPFLTGTAV
ncbi:Yip1 family protein [Acidaminobacter sp.]|uniref:Yip1 family protein n=1 Tax=Acidaminobacter sp. TaxID=1872102 RepID=UPI00137E231E|nr:Yip1 family protein [Acidaminobacter sp.]MDK9711892.1 YIP1 family protein [Acidaminobacter sp.]MZQ96413.1 hypothetical protein [Acidaminobacter sp.]